LIVWQIQEIQKHEDKRPGNGFEPVVGEVQFLEHDQAFRTVHTGNVILLHVQFLQEVKLRKAFAQLVQLVLWKVNVTQVLVLVEVVYNFDVVPFQFKNLQSPTLEFKLGQFVVG
jgi:hypothetical protein